MHQRPFITWFTAVSFLLSSLSSPLSGAPDPVVYPGNHGFIHETGIHVSGGWSARYRHDAPGYFLRGRVQEDERLDPGIYRYRFTFALPPGGLSGLLRRANDVVRLEVWDRTTEKRLAFRTLQRADFPSGSRKLVAQSIVFSLPGHVPHPVEPRLFWPGLQSLYLQKVELERLDVLTPKLWPAKAERLEQQMSAYLDRGMVVARRGKNEPEDTGDAAIWTGLYAAAEAWRYQSDHSSEALERMEAALRALHELHARSPQVGTLVRYIDGQGMVHPQAASKDSYTGFFFAMGQCWPWIRDPQLKAVLQNDIEQIAGHFLDHDLSFQPQDASQRLEFNPYLSQSVIDETLQDLTQNVHKRREIIRHLKWVQRYFRLHRQRGWRDTRPMIRALKRNDEAAMRSALLPFIRGAIPALHQIRGNVKRSAQIKAIGLSSDTPYGRLFDLMNRVLELLPAPHDIHTLQDLKVLPSESLHALHFVKVAAVLLPHPNRFEAYYQNNLWANKSLLKTVANWMNIDEDFSRAVMGNTRAAANRSSNNQLTFLALFNLMSLEKDPSLHQSYRDVFVREADPMQDEFNAMIETMRAVVGVPSPGLGLGEWSLQRYPEDRCGKGERYWADQRTQRIVRYGESKSGQARDPVPVDERPRDCFLWQRSARSLRGDDAGIRYPPMDYLFVYWMARANGVTSTGELLSGRLSQ